MDELLYQLKAFFLARNLDGKSLFRVLIKKAGIDKKAPVPQEISWKILELIFVVFFICRDKSEECIYSLALNGLNNKSQEINSLLSKSVI